MARYHIFAFGAIIVFLLYSELVVGRFIGVGGSGGGSDFGSGSDIYAEGGGSGELASLIHSFIQKFFRRPTMDYYMIPYSSFYPPVLVRVPVLQLNFPMQPYYSVPLLPPLYPPENLYAPQIPVMGNTRRANFGSGIEGDQVDDTLILDAVL
ncbi:hypothetical protein M569_11406 [Genlisea aurea]|uniref:Uncharacterized protein n=1 Tax=Genlisea aurea TaxID=192259 RepID=S8DKM6_9LAMI|nr:hypothetical protein M569_11406 [Genlisea aurea]